MPRRLETWRRLRTDRARFPNIPERLRRLLLGYESRYAKSGDRDLLYIAAAAFVIHEYLGRDVFKPGNDKFIDFRDKTKKGEFHTRVALIGKSLFVLRSCSGFDEICRRLATREMRPAYFELLAAKTFFRHGFDIGARPEVGRLKEDFDFTAMRDNLHINVEVTALQEREFHEKTLLNALNSKRRQLPKDKPAVIFCALPFGWEADIVERPNWLETLARGFLRGTRRVNILVFLMEQIRQRQDGSQGGLLLGSLQYSNENPYFPCDLQPILKGRGESGPLRELMEAAASSQVSDGFAVLAKMARTGEFYEWIELLGAPCQASQNLNFKTTK